MVIAIDVVAELLGAVEGFDKAAPAANQLRSLNTDPLAHAAFLFLVAPVC